MIGDGPEKVRPGGPAGRPGLWGKVGRFQRFGYTRVRARAEGSAQAT